MASHAAPKLQSARQKLLSEGRREREFYRYYQPIRELTKAGPPLCDLGDTQAVQAHRPFSSPDRALTAFCQLGALRMGMKRAILFFFDANYGYVLAESTRTLSLQDDSVHAENDDLWLGHTMIPRGYSVCEATVMLPHNEGSNRDDSSASMVHIVNDLAEDTRFCDRPFVTGGPKARFYAGVPITTPRGINIGAYCVLDDKRHDGLDADSIKFMRDMSCTVMTHLEMLRGVAEHKIGTQMIAGLGAFIDGASGFRDWATQKNSFGLDEDPNLSHPLGVQPMTTSASAVAQAAVQVTEHLGEDRRTSTSSSSPKRQRTRTGTITSNNSPSLLNPAPKHTGSLQSKRSAENFEDSAATSAQKTFERAATLIREGMSIDGVAFLDAAVGTFGGLVESVHTESSPNTELSSDCHGSAAEGTTGTEGEEKLDRIAKTSESEQTHKHCHILASSFVSGPPPNLDKHFNINYNTAVKRPDEITEKFLRSLLRRYPRGKIWSFNEYGDTSSDDESSEYNTDATLCSCSAGQLPPNAKHSQSCSKRRKKSRIDDCKEILRIFPGVRSVGIVGMWDHTRQRWYAASIFWSYSPLRLFSEESEVKYMTAFCDVILAELHRLEAQNSDQAKSDFISTISHELRSPLHGILGSAECLQEQQLDSFSSELVSQVEICGRTLLDIIDHLLDFSKINHHARSKVAPVPDGKGGRLSTNATKRSRMGGMMAIDNDVALDKITEEVVETAVYSFCSSRDDETILNRKVAVMMDIDHSPEIDWRCHVAVGAWKRICINLVSNALKYTSEGHVKVSLKASHIPDKKKRLYVTLTVSDTGRGMSRDFLENHLFRAFAQEDSLVEGTGLGMNLVAKIVRSFDGKIEVQSEKGIGSSFSITMPVERSRPRGRDLTRKTSSRSVDQTMEGITVGIIDNSSTPLATNGAVPDETARTLLLDGVHKILSQTSASTIPCTWAGDKRADLYFVTEGEVKEELQRRQDMGCADTLMSPGALSNKPFIILCDSALSARRIRAPGLGNIATGYVELIAQPAGPGRVVKAVQACLRNKSFVSKATAIAGAVKDIPAVVPHPDEKNISENLPVRSRQDATNLDSQNNSKTPSPDDSADTEKKRKEKRERDTGSDYRFPRIPSTPKSAKTMGPGTKKSPDVKANGGVSLLLVDDNPINLQLLITYADKFGHHKTVATDGQQAVEAYKAACSEPSPSSTPSTAEDSDPPPITRNDSGNDSVKPPPTKPQVILMDINMPVLNGFEATRQIRGFEKQKGVEAATIIALTGLGSASAQQEAFSSGVDLFLTKPVRLKELTKILEGIGSG